jgi:hypothetical protein
MGENQSSDKWECGGNLLFQPAPFSLTSIISKWGCKIDFIS